MSVQRSCPTFIQGFHGKASDVIGTPSALESISSCGHYSISEVSPPPPPCFSPHFQAVPTIPCQHCLLHLWVLLHNHWAALTQMRLAAVSSTLLSYLQTASLFWVKCTSLKQIYLHASIPLIQCNRNCMVRQGGNSFSYIMEQGSISWIRICSKHTRLDLIHRSCWK